MRIKKILLIILGIAGLLFGTIGAIVPLLPAFPFLLIAALSFAKSSERLNSWFRSTRLYKGNLEPFLKGEGMSVKVKVKIMLVITLLLGFGIFLLNGLIGAQLLLIGIWLLHLLIFVFKIKTSRIKG